MYQIQLRENPLDVLGDSWTPLHPVILGNQSAPCIVLYPWVIRVWLQKELMVNRQSRVNSVQRILPQHFWNELFRWHWDIFPFFAWEHELAFLDIFVKLLASLAEEGELAREENVDDDSNAPHVGSLVELDVLWLDVACYPLWRHVGNVAKAADLLLTTLIHRGIFLSYGPIFIHLDSPSKDRSMLLICELDLLCKLTCLAKVDEENVTIRDVRLTIIGVIFDFDWVVVEKWFRVATEDKDVWGTKIHVHYILWMNILNRKQKLFCNISYLLRR